MIRRLKEDGLVEVTGTAAIPCGIWKKVLVRRRACGCALTARFIIKGDYAYMPTFGGVRIRHNRVLAEEMEKHADYDESLGLRTYGGKR